MHYSTDILSTDGALGQFSATLDAGQHVSTLQQYTVHSGVHTHLAKELCLSIWKWETNSEHYWCMHRARGGWTLLTFQGLISARTWNDVP